LGPAVGGTLSNLFGYGVPSFLASALAFTNLVLAYFLLPEPASFNIKRTVVSFGAISVFTQAVLLPVLGKKFNRLNLTLLGIAFLVIGLAALSVVPNLAVLLVAAAVFSCRSGIT
jgi:hypothetical protein